MKPSSPIHAKWDLMSYSSASSASSSSHFSSLLLLLSSFYNSYNNNHHHHNKHRLVRNVVTCLLIGWVLFQLLNSPSTTEVATNIASNTSSTTKRYLQRRRNARIRNSLSYPPSTKPLYHPHIYEKSDNEVDVVVHNGLHRIGREKRYFLFPSWRIATSIATTSSSSSATTTASGNSGNSGINAGSSAAHATNGRLRRNSNWQLNGDRSYGSTTSSLRLDFH